MPQWVETARSIIWAKDFAQISSKEHRARHCCSGFDPAGGNIKPVLHWEPAFPVDDHWISPTSDLPAILQATKLEVGSVYAWAQMARSSIFSDDFHLRVLPGDHQLTTRSQHPPRSNPVKVCPVYQVALKVTHQSQLAQVDHLPRSWNMSNGHWLVMLRLYCIGYWYESPYHLFMGHLNIGANADALKILRQMSTEKIWQKYPA